MCTHGDKSPLEAFLTSQGFNFSRNQNQLRPRVDGGVPAGRAGERMEKKEDWLIAGKRLKGLWAETHLDGRVPLLGGRRLAHVVVEISWLRELILLLWHLDSRVLCLFQLSPFLRGAFLSPANLMVVKAHKTKLQDCTVCPLRTRVARVMCMPPGPLFL